jgi:hypothetical protein
MAKRKDTSNDLQNTTQKTKDLSNTNYQQPDDELGAPQWYAVSTPLVAHLSSQHNIPKNIFLV